MNSFLKPILFPFALLYGAIVFLRNKCYDLKIFHSVEFHLPVISVGNITVGGTGKTPHSEYLIRLLTNNYKVALLSRGYKRKTHGFILATEQSTADTIGDEPFQIKHKFPDLIVAVDNKRVNGIQRLLKNIPGLDIVLLDDAFQHRAVTPGINILLIDYQRPIKNDWMLPFGRLREPAFEKKRADIIIVTKTPPAMNVMERRAFEHQINAGEHQKVYFTSISYNFPQPVFPLPEETSPVPVLSKDSSILLLTGIAAPKLLIKEMAAMYKEIIHLGYPDHYRFTKKDIQDILTTFYSITSENKAILTTEKDAARLSSFEGEMGEWSNIWFYIPIEMKFMGNEEEHFNHQILQYVKNNSRNSILYKK